VATEAWETRRACVNPPAGLRVDPQWFDHDATKAARAEAEAVCWRCPVTTNCADKVRRDILDGIPVHGFYAGKAWKVSATQDMGEAEERRCAAPECPNVFLVTKDNRAKVACSPTCSARVRHRRQRRLARVKARNS
jgi:hypothetical protein